MSIDTYRKGIRSIVRGLWSGVISPDQFENEMRGIINRRLNQAFDEGAAEFEVFPEEYTSEEFTFIGQVINKELGSVSNFSSYIIKNSKENNGKLRPLLNRIELWVNRYTDVKNRAKILVGGNLKLEWKIGSTEKHCSTCSRLNGKVKRASMWKKEGIEPQNPPNGNLECGGWECKCTLVKTNKPISNGKLPKFSKKPVPKPKPKPISEPTTIMEPDKPLDKLDLILEQAPDNQDDFTQYLMEKVQNGEIEYPEAVELQSKFAKRKPKEPKKSTVEIVGDVPKGRIFTRKEFADKTDKKKWKSWEKSLTNDERNSLLDYKSEPFDNRNTSYREINKYLRGLGDAPTDETRQAIVNIDKAITKGSVPEDVVTYRGFRPSLLGDNIEDLVGSTIEDGGYTSVSLDKEVAKKFSKELMMEVRIPKGAKASYVDVVPVDDPDLEFEDEREILLPRNSKFRILSVEKDKKGVIQIIAELIL